MTDRLSTPIAISSTSVEAGSPSCLGSCPRARQKRSRLLLWIGTSVLSAVTLALPSIGRTDCNPAFQLVSQNGFGDTNNRYAWSMHAFGPHLYVGTLNRSAGAQVWRFDGNNWEQVVTAGLTSSDNVGVRNLEVCHGVIYGGTDNREQGAELWQSLDGATWTPIVQGGFGTQTIRSIRGLYCMMFDSQEYLYVGLQNDSGAGQLWRSSDGVSWQPLILDGFGDPKNSSVHAMESFEGALYAGTRNSDGLQIWRTFDGVTFEVVVGPGAVTPGGFGHERTGATMDLHEFDGNMYVGVINLLGGFGVYATANGVSYVKLGTDGFGIPFNDYSWRYATYENAIWLGTLNTLSFIRGAFGAGVWRSFNGTDWEEMVGTVGATHLGWGFDDPDNIGTRSMEVFQGKLYLGTAQDSRPQFSRPGLEVWEWPGEACP